MVCVCVLFTCHRTQMELREELKELTLSEWVLGTEFKPLDLAAGVSTH